MSASEPPDSTEFKHSRSKGEDPKSSPLPHPTPLCREADSEEFLERYDIEKLSLGITRHLFLIFLIILIFVGLGAFASYTLTHTYQAESVVTYKEETRQTGVEGVTLNQLSLSKAVDMIKLPENLQSVKSILGLDLSIKQLEAMVAVQVPPTNSKEIRIKVKSSNPYLSINLANTLASVAIKYSQEFSQKQLRTALDNYKNQLELVTFRLTAQLQKIEDFKKTNPYLEKTAEHSSSEKDLEDLQAQRTASEKQTEEKEVIQRKLLLLYSAIDDMKFMLKAPRGNLELHQTAAKAKIPYERIWVNWLPAIMLALGVGVGIFSAALLEMRDKRLRTKREVGLAYTIPCLSVIPEFPFMTQNNAQERMLFFVREIFESLEKTTSGIPFKSLAVTSSNSKEGKSLLSFCMASYGNIVGKKTLLLELDYRKNPFFEEIPFTPIEDYLRGTNSLEDILIKGNTERIRIGTSHHDIKRLLNSDQMVELWNILQGSYDLVVIDTPGIIGDDYAIDVAGMADHCLFVIDSTFTKKTITDSSLREMELLAIRPTGIILNRVLANYIKDKRILQELKRFRKGFWKRIFSRKSQRNKP